MTDEFDWLDVRPALHSGLENRGESIMREGGQEGKDRIWWCDGEYIWFRRSKSNPETLKRHNKFVEDGDYKHVETQGDVEIYQLQPQSIFKSDVIAGKQIDIAQMNNYNLRRQAALAACRRDWQAFRDIMTFLRERINAINSCDKTPGQTTPLAENIYAENYVAVMNSIEQRDGPGAGEINRELLSMSQNKNENIHKMISIGGEKRPNRLRLND